MATKVDAETLDRIVELRERDRLTVAVIAARLGLSMRSIRFYMAQLREEGRLGAPVRNGIYQQD